jgi:hypothetical protein
MTDQENAGLTEELDRLIEAGCDEGELLRALSLDFIETLHDDEALREENDQLRKMLHEPPSISHRIAGWANLKTVADLTGFSIECVRLWAVRGAVDALRSGGVWQVRVRSAIAYARRQRGGFSH